MKRKILFLDLDGTLLTDKKEITRDNRDALQDAVQAGHAVAVTTGRPLYSAAIQTERLGLTTPGCFAITSNGALIYNCNTGEILFQTGVPRDCVREAFDEAYKYGIHPQTYSSTGVLCEDAGEEMQYYAKSTLVDYELTDDVTQHLDCNPIKLLFIDLHDRNKLESFRRHMEPWSQKNHVDMFFSCNEYLEFLPKGINKGSGIRFLCDYLNIPIFNTLAAGDAENDITMLQTVAFPCVMRNARPEMYSYGKYITENDNNHSGVAEIVRKFMLQTNSTELPGG